MSQPDIDPEIAAMFIRSVGGNPIELLPSLLGVILPKKTRKDTKSSKSDSNDSQPRKRRRADDM